MGLAEDVKKWATETFKTQIGDKDINPLLGIGEEFAEYLEAETVEDKLDALADAGIFFFDFISKKGLKEEDLESDFECDRVSVGIDHLMRAAGKLNHVVLKTAQKIRGLEDPKVAKERLVEASQQMWATLKAFTLWNHEKELLPLMQTTFDAIVSKRTHATLQEKKDDSEPSTK